MNVVSLVTLPVNAVHVVVDDVVAVVLGTAEVPAMVEGVTVLVVDPQGVAAHLPAVAATADHLQGARKCHMLMAMD